MAFGHSTSDGEVRRVRIKRFDGSGFTELPVLHPETEDGGSASIAAGSDGLFAAWQGDDGNVYAQRFVADEGRWAPIGPDPEITGGIATPTGEDAGEDGARVPSLALDGESPAVAYRLRPLGGAQQLHVAAPDPAGDAWERRAELSVGTSELLEGELFYEEGNLHLSWPFWGSSGAGISVRREADPDWTEVAHASELDSVRHARVAFAGGMLYAVWSVSRDGVHAGVWNGEDAFVGLGGDGETRIADDDQSATGGGPRIAAASDGTVWVSWLAGRAFVELHLAALREGGFEEVGVLDVTSYNEHDLAIDPEGRPTVAYRQDADIAVQRWTGSAWDGIDGSEGEGGVSQTGAARRPRLAVGDDGRIGVAWEDSDTGSGEVYAVVHTAADGWHGIAGSNEAGGVSNSGMASVEPDVAVGPDLVCVAWSDGGFVTMRCAL